MQAGKGEEDDWGRQTVLGKALKQIIIIYVRDLYKL